MIKNILEVLALGPSSGPKEKVLKRPSQRFGGRPFSTKAVMPSAAQKENCVGKIATFRNFTCSGPSQFDQYAKSFREFIDYVRLKHDNRNGISWQLENDK